MRTYRRAGIGLVVVLMLAAAACSSGAGETTTTTSSTTTSTTTTAPTTTTTRPAPTTTVAEPVPLVVWTDEELGGVLESAAAAFESDYGIPVEFEFLDDTLILERLREQGSTAEADIFTGSHMSVGELAGQGVLAPIDFGIRTEEWLEVALEAFEYGGASFGVPLSVDGVALYVNSDLVAEAPESFEDLIDSCDALGEAVDPCLGHPDIDDGLRHGAFLISTGGYFFAFDRETGYDTGDIGLDTERALTGMVELDRLAEGGYVDSAAGGDEMLARFTAGTSAFILAGPDALEAVDAAGFPYTVTPLPEIGDSRGRTLLASRGMFVRAGTPMEIAALTFLFDYVSDPDVASRLPSIEDGLPALAAAASGLLDGFESAQGLLEAIVGGEPAPNLPEIAVALDAFGGAVERIYERSAVLETALGVASLEIRAALSGD
jgi:maltose-binding protein MalE